MKVDNTPPQSDIALGPRKPDGAEIPGTNWYRTRPFFAFAATDKAGGSGVDRSIAPSGIFYAVDGGPSGTYASTDFTLFDPNADLRLSNGVHDICWFAVDVAGNKEAGGNPHANDPGGNCQFTIKVDDVAPAIANPISPAAPDGSNGFYTSTPSVSGTSTDAHSGVARVEQQIDEGDWASPAPTSVAEGAHTVRTRSFDVAGNPSEILERRVFVDRSDPSAKLVSFPPAPNSRGWYRRTLKDSIATSDGRDGSGPNIATFTVNGGGPSTYLAPFGVGHGVNTVGVRARDVAGRQGAQVTQTQKVDTIAPSGAPVGQTTILTLPAIGLPNPVALKYNASNELPGQVRVQVRNVLGVVVRRMDAGWVSQGAGQFSWNGRNDANKGVLPGTYTYRVHVTDEAGNTVLSTESKPFIVVLGLLPL